jgi:hypothetical protein
MARRTMVGGALALSLTLTLAASAAAATVPRATLVKKADAICAAHNKQRAANPHPLPAFSNPATATAKQMKAAAPWFARSQAILKDEVTKVFALGTPSEPAARVAWKRLHVILTTVSVAGFGRAAEAARRGDAKAFTTEYVKASKFNAEEAKLGKALGLKVCGGDG